jgi:threonine/homoserine efflux transporter RhtA
MLVIPAVAVVGGIVFLGERPSMAELSALGLVLTSLATVIVPARGTRR